MARRYFTKPSLEAWFTAVKACNPKKAKGQGFTIFLSATQLLGTISANTKSNILSLVLCVFCSEWKQAPLGPWSYGETDKPDRAEQRTFLFQGISLENNIENIIIGNASSHLYCNPSIKKVLYLHKWWWNDSFSSGQWDHISSVSPGQSFCQQTPPITKHENIDPLVDWWGGISARPSSSSSEKPSISSRLSLLPCHPDNWSTNEDYPSPHETLLGASLFTPVLTIGAKTQV